MRMQICCGGLRLCPFNFYWFNSGTYWFELCCNFKRICELEGQFRMYAVETVQSTVTINEIYAILLSLDFSRFFT